MLTACPDELPNPHKNCIREMLNSLICSDNDVKRLNTKLRDLQKEYQKEMDKFDIKCMRGKPPICESVETLTDFARQIGNIDELKQHFSRQADELKKKRDNIILYARQCLYAYNEEKCKFRAFHENTADYLKRNATLSQDKQVIQNCETDLCEMHKRFVKEVANIKRAENELLPFFKMLKESDPNSYCECCCLKNLEWLPPSKGLDVVDSLGAEIKEQMGKTLAKAFAELHMHQPQDAKEFIAGYLMNLVRVEELMKEKLDILQKNEQEQIEEVGYECPQDRECVKEGKNCYMD